ncbi:MAG: hypothetical protein AAGA77_21395 [Bacteroidota bacterium]
MRRIDLPSGILWCLIFMISCSSPDSNSPEVSFIDPKLNAHHDLNTDLKIEIDISDDQMVKEYEFWMETHSGFEYFLDKKDVNQPQYKIQYRFNLSNNINGDFSIHLNVWDDDGNKTYESLEVSIR